MSTPVVAPGKATVTMRIRDDMVNGQGNCHGGYLATLADSAFAFACNTYDQVTVAAGFDIVFVAPARLGDQLVATAVERAASVAVACTTSRSPATTVTSSPSFVGAAAHSAGRC